jgi:hypothetical protein
MSPDAPMLAAVKMAHARAGRQTIDKAKDFQVGRARVAALPPVSVLRYSAEELDEGALCSISEAATILRISQQGVRAMIDRGQLASYRDKRGRRVVVTSDLADTQAGRQAAALGRLLRRPAQPHFRPDRRRPGRPRGPVGEPRCGGRTDGQVGVRGPMRAARTLDARVPTRHDGRAMPPVLLVERLGRDAEARWARALDLLLAAGGGDDLET